MAEPADDALEVVFDAMPALVIYKDTENNILRVNRAVAASLGVSAEEMRGTPSSRWYPDLADEYYLDDLKVIRSGEPRLGIVEPIDVGGERRWFQTDKFPTRDDDGKVTGVVLVAQDITDRKVLEERVEEAQRMEAIGRLAGGVAHDFNNLLTAISGFASIAATKARAGRPIGEPLEQVQQACERAGRLTQSLLAFARKQISRPQPTDVSELVRGMSTMLRSVVGERIVLEEQLEPGATAELDRGQVEQVLLNLVINARDAMPGGGRLTISTTVCEVTEEAGPCSPGRYVQLAVADDGMGMTPETVSRVFEPFFTTKAPGEGTGLGLAVCFGIVKQHRGNIVVQSRRDEGTTVEVWLPWSPVAAETPSKSEGLQPAPPSHQRILVVEDEPAVRAVVEAALKHAGYSVVALGDAETALSLSGGERFDLLVSDVVMPTIDGAELAERLTRQGRVRSVLLMSGYAGHVLDAATAWPLLAKPFTATALIERVRVILEESAAT